MKTKKCPTCEEVKTAEENFYHRSGLRKNQYRARCKECELKIFSKHEATLPSVDIGTKVCMGPCGLDLPFVYYHKNKHGKYGLLSKCKKCISLEGRQRRKNNPEKYRESVRKHYTTKGKWRTILAAYGVTEEMYTARLVQQGGRCKICGKDEIGRKRLCVDHNHSTGEIRGLLCSKCNLGISQFNDDRYILQKAIEYLS